MYLALVSAKYAGQPSGYNQLLHTDFPNHTLVVPRPRGRIPADGDLRLPERRGHRNGATRFVPGPHRRDPGGAPHPQFRRPSATSTRSPAEASAPAGSIVAYRPDVYHRSVDFDDPAQARFMLHVAYRPAGIDWGGYQAWPSRGSRPSGTTSSRGHPAQLTVLGFPPPGHAYWTEETLAGVGRALPRPGPGPMAGGAPSG